VLMWEVFTDGLEPYSGKHSDGPLNNKGVRDGVIDGSARLKQPKELVAPLSPTTPQAESLEIVFCFVCNQR
jgi:hypothetical protein